MHIDIIFRIFHDIFVLNSSPLAGLGRYLELHLLDMRWSRITYLLRVIEAHFGLTSTTGCLVKDILDMGDELLEKEMLTGAKLFIILNPIMYASHNLDGFKLRRSFHRHRSHMDYEIPH